MNADPAALPLRDIQLPDPIAWWPSAPGWWLLFGGLAFVIGSALACGWWRRRTAVRRAAHRELRAIAARYAADRDGHRAARALSMLARRVAVWFAGPDAAAATGERWLAELDALGGQSLFREGPGRALASAPYRREGPESVESLLTTIEHWIHALPAAPRRQDRATVGAVPVGAAASPPRSDAATVHRAEDGAPTTTGGDDAP